MPYQLGDPDFLPETDYPEEAELYEWEVGYIVKYVAKNTRVLVLALGGNVQQNGFNLLSKYCIFKAIYECECWKSEIGVGSKVLL